MRSALFAMMLLTISAVSRAEAPDPRDSVILESKTVAPGLVGKPVAFTMKVYITNKDTIAILMLALVESTLTKTGSAYAVLDSTGSAGDPDGWTLADCLTFLKKTLDSFPNQDFTDYNGTSPDRFLVWSTFAPTSTNPLGRSEPPNATRSAIWELQFMSSSKATGKVRLDTTRVARAPQLSTGFTITRQGGQSVADIPVNFLPGVITVKAAPKGDFFPDSERPSKNALLHFNGGSPGTATGWVEFLQSELRRGGNGGRGDADDRRDFARRKVSMLKEDG